MRGTNENAADLCLFESLILIFPNCENTSAPQDLRELHRESPISAEKVVKLVNNLVPSLQEGDPFFVPTFLSTYRTFVTTLHVLGLLFMRYPYFHPHSVEHRQVKSSLCTFLHTWMDK
uniref:N-terminal Ras-GEF domain-containing protein n=1 Tax=Mus spicilegus TaxID=10103 RepID=A0A8C6GCI7_MUSSI